MICPWCNEKVNHNQLGRRLAKNSPKPHQFTLIKPARYITVCPFCNKGVKVSKENQLWALLIFPLIIYMIFPTFYEEFTHKVIHIPEYIGIILMVIAVIGGGVGLITTLIKMKLEKCDDI